MHSGAKDEHDIFANFLRCWQAELDDIAQDLKNRATKTRKKPASFALMLSGVAVALATGHPLAAALSVGAVVTGYQAAAKRDAGAYSYLFRAHDRYGLS
jgi:lysozyme family protein